MRAFYLFSLALPLALWGCGGSGGGASPETVGANAVKGATFQIDWPTQGRGGIDHGLTAAKSVLVTLPGAGEDGSDVTLRIDRDGSRTGAYTSTHRIDQGIVTTARALTATFYAKAGETGDVVGTATAAVALNGTQMNLGSVVVSGNVKTVGVIEPKPLTVGDDAVPLLATTQDASGATVAVAPGSIKWSLTDGGGSLKLNDDGTVKALADGTATLTASVNGVTSAPVRIVVRSVTLDNTYFRIAWPARTRADIDVPLTSALSAEVVLIDGAEGGSDVTVIANRDPEKKTAHIETYTVKQSLSPSVNSLQATFYSKSRLQGEMVGTATAKVIPTGERLEVASLKVKGRIKTVEVLTPKILIKTNEKDVQLLAATKDADGEAVAVSSGSLRWAVTDGKSHLKITPAGVATGIAPGPATVTATVDGVTSQAFAVMVQAGKPVPTLQVIHIPAVEIAYDKVNDRIWATVPSNGGTYANKLVSIVPSTGKVDDAINIGGAPSQLSIIPDGTYAFVAVEGDTTIRRVDLRKMKVDKIYKIQEGGYSDISAVPGRPDMFMVAVSPIGGRNLTAYKDGKRLEGLAAVGYEIHFAGDSSTLIYGDGHDSLFEDRVSDTEVIWTDQDGLNVTGFQYSNKRLYTNAGTIVDPVRKTIVAQLNTSDFLVDHNVAVSDADDRVYFVTWNSSTPKHIVTFDKTRRKQLSVYDTGYQPGGAQNMVGCGSHTVAFRIYGSGEDVICIARGLP